MTLNYGCTTSFNQDNWVWSIAFNFKDISYITFLDWINFIQSFPRDVAGPIFTVAWKSWDNIRC